MPKTVKLSTIQDTKVNSFNEFLDSIEALDKFSRSGSSVLLFRGQKEADWDLLPGLARPKFFRPEIERFEKNIIADFKRRAVPFLPKTFNANSEWEWLALAQHFKLPTRLLDWTENPLVALYFCFEFEKSTSSERAVWAFATIEDELADTIKSTSSPYSQNKTRVYVPNQVTQRITAQSGWFTVHRFMTDKKKFIPLNKNSGYVSRIFKISIPNKLREDLLQRLDRLGVNSFSIYPDLEGLSNFLTWKHFK